MGGSPRHIHVGGRRQRAARRVVGVVGDRRRSGNTDRSVPSKVKQSEQLGGAQRYDESGLGLRAWEFAAAAPCELIARENFPESATNRFGGIEDA